MGNPDSRSTVRYFESLGLYEPLTCLDGSLLLAKGSKAFLERVGLEGSQELESEQRAEPEDNLGARTSIERAEQDELSS